MASLYSFSASSASSDSENEMRDMQFNINKMDFNQTHFSLKNSSALSLSCQTSNNSSSFFKKLKRKNEPETRLKNKYKISPYSLLRPLKINNNLLDSKNKTNYNNKKEEFNKKQTEHLNHTNLNKEFSAYTMESSSGSTDSPDMKHLTQNSKIKKINNSSGNLETRKNKLYTKRKKSNINNLNINKENIKPIEYSTSLNSIEFSDVNTNFPSSQNTDLYTNTLKLDDIFLDCSLSGDDLIKKDNYDKNSEKLYPLPDTDSLFIQTKTPNLVPPLKPTQINISLGGDVDKPLSPPSTDIFINLSDLNNLMNDDEKNTGISKPVSLLKPLQMNISFDINDNEPLSQKLTDFNYQSDLNDLMSDESTEDIQNHNADILKPLSFANSLQMNISSDIDDNEPLSQKSTDFIFQSDLNNLISDESTEHIQSQNDGILKALTFAKPLQMNTCFEINNDEILAQKSTDFIFQSNLNDLMSDEKTDEVQNKNAIEIKEQEHIILNNEHSDINKLKLFSLKVDLNEPKPIYNSKSNIKHINHKYNNSSLKSKIKNSQIDPESKNKKSKEQNKSKSFHEDDLNEPKLSTSNYSLSNTESIDSTFKYHQSNRSLKNEIPNTQIGFEPRNKASKEQTKSKCFQEDDLNESILSIPNYSKSNAESILRIIDSTSKCHQYNNKSKNKVKNTSQVDSEPKKKNYRKPKHVINEFDLNEPEPSTSNYSLSNTKSIDSTLKYHQCNRSSKNEILNTQIGIESRNKASKEQTKSKCFQEDDLNESILSISNYPKSNAESILRIIDSTSKCHQYNNKSKNNKIKNISHIDSETKKKKCRKSKHVINEFDLNEPEPSTSNYSLSNTKIIDSTLKCHQYNDRSKNKIKNTSQIKSEPKKKKCKKAKLLNEPELLTSNYSNSNTESIDSTSKCYQYNSVSKLKIKNIQIDIEQNKTKHSCKTTNTTSDILPINRPSSIKNIKKNCSAINTSEDIGLEYDTSKDDYMVELPNGTVIPAFLSTLKPKYGKKLCACGIPTSEAPNYWSESFHESLHQNIYKLRFKGNVSDNNTINVKQNNLFYRILILDTEHYNDSDIKKSVKEVDEFVCLEYGIFKTGSLSYKNYTYLAVLPNLRVIGYLEVEPIHEAYKINNDEQEQPVEIKVPAKFGVPKVWVFIKYKNKNVDINLLETFRKKEHLQKEDLAFSLGGCLGVQFIQEYTGNKNILIYKQ